MKTPRSGGDLCRRYVINSGDHYSLVCTRCGARVADDGMRSGCALCGDDSMLRTEYEAEGFGVDPGASGVFRYRQWLPVRREVAGSGRPAVFRSEGLGGALGLRDLWISFSGYWPERNCGMRSGTFKELEAYTVLGRVPEDAGVMVVASAGNTAAAFAAACRDYAFPCLLVIPERAVAGLAVAGEVGEHVKVVALEGATYNQAIAYSRRLVASSPEFFAEGGVRNVGRRDGLAVVALTAYEETGRLPDFYFQGVGSGAGAIATYEAAGRIIRASASSGGDEAMPRLFLCQNAEFAPLHEAWTGAEGAHPDGQRQVLAPELVNAAPPFSLAGGVRDILTHSAGEMLVADRTSALAASAMFEELEGVDIEPAAAVAVACLRDAVLDGRVPKDARILLNVTGGGRRRSFAELDGASHRPDLRTAHPDSAPEAISSDILNSFSKGARRVQLI
ncbi:cysteate synthase [Streptomyces sp. NPDC021096]|uniref:cysteate synthase n=1 Tax=Streptomyces sp. NPDC021096 TaxID=3154792 RepID=UPI0033F177E8